LKIAAVLISTLLRKHICVVNAWETTKNMAHNSKGKMSEFPESKEWNQKTSSGKPRKSTRRAVGG